MLTLINSNRMQPPIAPIGLDYVAAAARRAGIDVELLDLCLCDDPDRTLAEHFAHRQPRLVGVSLRNVDDCFFPGHTWFLPDLQRLVQQLRELTDAPIVLGGVGLSIFPREIVDRSGADFGIWGDGEQALSALWRELDGSQSWPDVPGLVWRREGTIVINGPAWPQPLSVPAERNFVDNRTYFHRGGQVGLETKRGCNRRCAYCADPLAKGPSVRRRDPEEVADEVESLLAQGVDVLHLCDAEFNLPADHARDVCNAMIRRRLGDRVRWYAYLAVVPFDAELAGLMRRAGCVGINFTSDAANATMLAAYRQPHRPEDLTQAVRLCRASGIAVMTDLLLGGPGETPETVAESIGFFKHLDPDCAGAALGVRLYPGTAVVETIAAQGPMEENPGIRRCYQGPIDLVRPTYYVSPALGPHPARLIRELIGGDPRFFEPEDDTDTASGVDPHADYNYNANHTLCDAIARGARGAYWDILRKLRRTPSVPP